MKKCPNTASGKHYWDYRNVFVESGYTIEKNYYIDEQNTAHVVPWPFCAYCGFLNDINYKDK